MRIAPSLPHFAALNAGYKAYQDQASQHIFQTKKGAVATAAAPFNYSSVGPQFEFDGRISTRPIALTPLSAIAILLSRVTNI